MAEERSVGELLDELFGFESVAKRQTALEQYDRGELLRKARSRELLAVIGGVEAAERAARESAVRAVDGYVSRVEFDSLARARKQVGVVGPLQMERRYAAFLRMEDKAELLARLEQTLAFIEVKLRANTADRVRAAYDAAGALVLQGAAGSRGQEDDRIRPRACGQDRDGIGYQLCSRFLDAGPTRFGSDATPTFSTLPLCRRRNGPCRHDHGDV